MWQFVVVLALHRLEVAAAADCLRIDARVHLDHRLG